MLHLLNFYYCVQNWDHFKMLLVLKQTNNKKKSSSKVFFPLSQPETHIYFYEHTSSAV